MAKVVQVRAAIARHGSAFPAYLDLMGSDARDRAQTGRLVAVPCRSGGRGCLTPAYEPLRYS